MNLEGKSFVTIAFRYIFVKETAQRSTIIYFLIEFPEVKEFVSQWVIILKPGLHRMTPLYK